LIIELIFPIADAEKKNFLQKRIFNQSENAVIVSQINKRIEKRQHLP